MSRIAWLACLLGLLAGPAWGQQVSGGGSLPIATTTVLGGIKPDGTTITVDGSTGVATSIGGSATTITPGTTTIVGATAPCIIQNSTSTTMACSPAAGSLVSITDTTHTTSASTANVGGQDDYNGSSITGTLATLASGQTLFVTDQNATALTISNNSQTVNGLPLSTTLHTGGFYGYTYNTTTSQISGYGFPGFGTITSGALMEFDDATGAATAGPTPGTGVATALGNNLSAAGGLTTTIASGTATLGTGAISSAACATVVTVSATNVATTDVLTAGFNGDPTAVTGYVPLTAGMLTIIDYPTSGNVNFKVCNNTSSSITPGAITLNWRVVR